MNRVLLACLAFAAVCARAAGDTPVPVGHVSQLMAGEPGPVDYKDYASLLAPAMLLAHGDWATADQAIAQLFSQIGQEIESVYRVITGQSKPQFTINPPQLFNNGATNVSTTLAGAQGLAVGINYNPCVISVSTRGADVTAAGINVQPNVIEVLAEGAAVWPWAVNIQPALIYVNPWGVNVSPEGATITPALIAIAPTAVSVGQVGKEVQTVGIAVPPP